MGRALLFCTVTNKFSNEKEGRREGNREKSRESDAECSLQACRGCCTLELKAAVIGLHRIYTRLAPSTPSQWGIVMVGGRREICFSGVVTGVVSYSCKQP